MLESFLPLLTAAVGGGVIVKLADIFYQEYRHRAERKRTARAFVNEHLDPLLKAADELVGKLRALAADDFKVFERSAVDVDKLEPPDLAALVYLFGKFWAQIEILRARPLSAGMGKDKRGKRLQHFLDCLESRRVRIIDRISQRAAGEVLCQQPPAGTLSFVSFVTAYESDAKTRRWVQPLCDVIARIHHTRERQRILQYGVVLHALIDTLDSAREVTRERPSYPNKLTRKSQRDLNFRVFGQYLRFVPNTAKYIRPVGRRKL